MNVKFRLAATLGLYILACGGAFAQDNKAPVKRDPKVQAVLDQVIAAYKALTALQLKISVKTTGPTDMLSGAPESAEVRFQKPNKLYSDTSTRGKAKLDRKLIVCDGASLWSWTSATNTYTKSKAPAQLKSQPNLGDELPEFDLLFKEKDPFADLPVGAQLSLGSPSKVGTVDVDVLRTVIGGENVPFSVTIEFFIGQKDHLFHRMLIGGNGKDGAGKEAKFQLDMTYDVVNPSPTFAPADFTFTPPSGSKPASAVTAKPTPPHK